MLQFRKLLIMATETAAKKLKTEGPLIGTHKYVRPVIPDGSMHFFENVTAAK